MRASNPDKVLFPGDGIDKRKLVEYYRRIAPVMLPHARGRLLTVQRFPDGLGERGFFQQHRADHFPFSVPSHRAPRADSGASEPIEHFYLDGPEALTYLADQAAITFHGWLSRVPRIDEPDRLMLDLDPGEAGFGRCVSVARRVAERLADSGLEPFVMTTGSSGLHVVAPLRAGAGFEQARAFARALAGGLVGDYPDEVTLHSRKSERKGRLYLDVARNAYGLTSVLPYSVRALPGAPVATPLEWDELGRSGLHARRYTLDNLFRRLGQRDDPWASIERSARTLPGHAP